jgi:hypothetical protein
MAVLSPKSFILNTDLAIQFTHSIYYLEEENHTKHPAAAASTVSQPFIMLTAARIGIH